MEQFDYIIVGAGSAGSVLADQLSASGRHRVLVLESGPKDRSPWIHVPAGYGKLFYHPQLNYGYHSEPQPTLQGRQDYWPRGHVVGGSGAINAMVYCRGMANDFDDWERAGATGWNWATAKETYGEIETQVAPDGQTQGAGPIHVSDMRRKIHPANRHFFNALNTLQLPQTDDMNGDAPEGGGVYRLNTRKGRRCAAAQAFLKPALKRQNLELRTDAKVQRVLFEGKRATGVLVTSHGELQEIKAGEVILSAGAVHSPLILQRSGLGSSTLLQRHGVEVIVANGNVGGNLQDHLGINYYFQATEPTLNQVLGTWLGKARAALQYALTQGGPLSLSVNQCGGFFRSTPDQIAPDQQLYFNPVTYTTTQHGTRNVIHPDPFPGFILGMQPTRPTSRGRIEMTGTRHEDAPRIVPNSLETDADQQMVINGGRLCAKILNAPALQGLIKAPMYVDVRGMLDCDILEDFRARCGTVFHPVSTCRMGGSAETAVIDPKMRVFGVEGLRVVDASAFPNITSGNTNAPTMMLAHRAAKLIKETSTK